MPKTRPSPRRGAGPSSDWRRSVLLSSAFFLSGAAGLIYEVTWVKALTLIFGSTVYAVTTVLVAFMGGLGVGSWALGTRLDRHARPIQAYACLEAGIALSAPLTFALIPVVRAIYLRVGDGAVLWFFGTLALLLVPTVLMGGTLPVLVRVFRASAAETGRPVSRLYALNTAGAVTGTLLAGFVLIVGVGILWTALLAAAGNLLAAALAWSSAARDAQTGPRPVRYAGDLSPHRPDVAALWVALVSFVSGATSMALEIAWTRLLATPLSSSTYAFTVMLAAFLIGIAAGSRLFSAVTARRPVNREGLALLQLATALAGLLVLMIWRLLPQLVFAMMHQVEGSFFWLVIVQFVAAFLVLLPPALLYGVNFPYMAALYAPGEREAGGRVGRLYAVNTAGAIFGSVLAGFFLLPHLGSYAALALAAAASGAAGIVLASGWRRRAVALAGLAVIFAGGGAAGLFRHSRLDQQGVAASFSHATAYRSQLSLSEIADLLDYVFIEDGLNATVAVARSQQNVSLKINGKTDASARDMNTQVLLGALPLAMHPRPRRVLVIGFGSGATTRIAALWPGVESVDTVEIEPAVLHAAPYLKAMNGEVYRDPRSRLIIDDARHYLFATRQGYDVIISEPSNPWMAGVGNLFTVEFYREARARLNQGGIFTQWVQGYEFLPEDLSMVARTIGTVFPWANLWSGMANDFLLVAADAPVRPSTEQYQNVLRAPSELQQLLRRYLGLDGRPAGMWAYFGLDDRDLKRFAASGELNTDDQPLLEYRAPWRLLEPANLSVAQAVVAARVNPLQLSPEEGLDMAETLVRIGHLEPVPALLGSFPDLMADSPRFWLLRGDFNRAGRNYAEAESSYQRALEKGGGARALAGLAMVAAETSKPDTEALLRHAIDAGGSLPPHYLVEPLFALGGTLGLKGRYDEALEWEKRALAAADPLLAPAIWVQIAEMHSHKGDTPAALAAVDQALALDPYNYAGRRKRADLLVASGRLQESLPEFRFLLRFHALTDVSLYGPVADALRKAGHGREADRALALGRRAFPGSM